MPLLDLKVRVIPDMKEFNRKVQQGVSGGGAGGRDNRGQSGKGANVQVSGFGKLLGIAGGIAAILSSVEFVVKPVMELLKATIALLFIPLVPILKPLLKAWANFIKFMKPVFEKIRDGVERFVAVIGDGISWVWENILEPIWEGLKKAFNWLIEKLTNIGDKVKDAGEFLAEKLRGVKDFVVQGFQNVVNAVIDVINRIPGVSVGHVGGNTAPSPVSSSGQSLDPNAFGAGGQSIQNTINLNNPQVSNSRNIRNIAEDIAGFIGRSAKRSLLYGFG